MIICRACQQELPDDACFCGYCGFRVGPVEQVSAAADGKAMRFAPEPALAGGKKDVDAAYSETVMAPMGDLIKEQRAAARYTLRVDLSYSSAHNFYTGLTENISTGGLFVATDEPVDVGELVKITLTIPGFEKQWAAVCEVRWIRGQDEAGGSPGMGLRFVDLDPALEAAIDVFIAHREPILSEE